MKLALWAMAAVVLVMWWLGRKRQSALNDRPDESRRREGEPEPMVRCAHCGVHVPASEAFVTASGAVFCSEEHSRQ